MMLDQELLSSEKHLFFYLIRRFFSPNFENLQKKVVSPNLQILLSGHYLACKMVSHLTVEYSRKQNKQGG